MRYLKQSELQHKKDMLTIEIIQSVAVAISITLIALVLIAMLVDTFTHREISTSIAFVEIIKNAK